jgi:hypothetical protein
MKRKQLVPLALSLLIAGSVHAQKKFVKMGIGGPHTGTSWATAYDDLQTAINAATPGDSIFVARGNYFPTVIAGTGTDRDKTFLLRDLVSVFGGFDGTEAELDDRDAALIHLANASYLNGNIGIPDSSDNVHHVVTAINVSGRTTFDGFVVSNGNADGSGVNMISGTPISRFYGGGVYSEKSDLLIRSLLVENNTTLVGGAGLYNHSSPVTVEECMIRLNKVMGADPSAGGGAGMFNVGSNARISNSSFTMNHTESAQGGGGMRNESSFPELQGVEFYQNNTEDGDGGAGMYNALGSQATLNNVSFEMNVTQNQGAGMYNDNSSPILTNVTFYQNKASGGGGAMENDGGSNAVLRSVEFYENSTPGNGGAMQNWKSSPIMEQVFFIYNTANGDGGAVYNYNNCSPVMSSCFFYANLAIHDGGGFYNKRASHPVMTNCVYARNTAGHDGGGIYTMAADGTGSEPSSPVLTNVTIANNVAGNTGGGGYDDGFGKTRLRNSIISGNVAPVIADVDAPPTVLDSVTASIIENLYYPKGLSLPLTLITTDIFLDTLADEYRLAAMSQAIDMGDSSFFKSGMTPDLSAITTDIEGADRVMGLNIDLGAFEVCTDTLRAAVTVAVAPGTSVPSGTLVTFTATGTNPGAFPAYMWRKNGTMITVTPTPVYTATAGLDFITGDKITVTLFPDLDGPCTNGDSVLSNQLTMTIPSSGIPEWDNNAASVSVVPNPNNGSFALKVSGIDGKQVTVSVIDVTGRSVYTESFTGSNSAKTLNLNGKIPGGTYLLSLEGDEVIRQVKRFVIQ